MTTSNASAYFNIFAPCKGPGDAAMFIGSPEGLAYEGAPSRSATSGQCAHPAARRWCT